MSISLCLLLLVGVVTARHASNQDNDAEDGRIAPIQLVGARQICASLCMSGLGGNACGVKTCESVQPDVFPVQSDSNLTSEHTIFARRDACPLLCKYQLGEPLCFCPEPKTRFNTVFHEIDFNEICGFFCLNHNYYINGCNSCEIYRKEKEYREKQVGAISFLSLTTKKIVLMKRRKDTIDWDEWCRDKCSQGDGGAACNCDILPLSLVLDAANPDSPPHKV